MLSGSSLSESCANGASWNRPGRLPTFEAARALPEYVAAQSKRRPRLSGAPPAPERCRPGGDGAAPGQAAGALCAACAGKLDASVTVAGCHMAESRPTSGCPRAGPPSVCAAGGLSHGARECLTRPGRPSSSSRLMVTPRLNRQCRGTFRVPGGPPSGWPSFQLLLGPPGSESPYVL
jgi:hypothetical protein